MKIKAVKLSIYLKFFSAIDYAFFMKMLQMTLSGRHALP
ncbi:hypothetical protein BACIH_1293 [Bacillus amyloliquefaciens]|nr:hypothetical protein U471_13220 [Bacillus amyloliquefaciens CC178]KYC88247.1 hypothetical protein B4140_1423 [Bacillus amyloliquefaciens]QEY88377.1 hypothetical protein BACIT_0402 [Bacillus amyloliquefaciens]QEY93048.1 hypothetical protein BACIH_1293 [Bacillus amyloliquefaciens]RUS05840.1 hypothetical protein EFW58_01879 [Bacillus velezensis]